MISRALSSTSFGRSVDTYLKHHVRTAQWLWPQLHQHAHVKFFQTSQQSSMSAGERPAKPARVVVALGSNLGDRIGHIESALQLMRENGVNVAKTSPLYESKAAYYEDQGPFINGACEIHTDKEPLDLLDTLQAIENKLGRVRTISKGPRTIDLDIIAYDAKRIDTSRLQTPHPGLFERDFVLRPLKTLCPNMIPVKGGPSWTGIPVSELYKRLAHRDDSMSRVTQLSPNLPPIRSTDPTRTTQIMAILNLTPDSFSDGGTYSPHDADALRSTVRSFISAGATIIDIGGQSTRPGAQPVEPSEELARTLPAIRLIRSLPEAHSTAISIDTFHADVAREALVAGADIINDVSAGKLSNNEILKVVAEARKTIVLMHMRGDPTTMTSNEHAHYPRDIVTEVAEELRGCVKAALEAGIPRWRIILDPGFGFAKKMHHNLELLNRFAELRASPLLKGLPWLVGTSRKGFIGKITGVKAPSERVMGTAATVTASIAAGADIVRVHDVKAMVEVVKMSDAIYRQWRDPEHAKVKAGNKSH
jgi:2-amino-4-hydroxy-6-hydroxymethyldihydropteridine diphosphokinase / dihydropteroate synthase